MKSHGVVNDEVQMTKRARNSKTESSGRHRFCPLWRDMRSCFAIWILSFADAFNFPST